MRVYKFMDANYGISNIALKRLKVSRLNQLNDPFEFLAADLLDTRDRKALATFKNQMNDSFGVVCFSGSWSNPLLWGHYAQNHSGLVLGFDIPDDHLLKVYYTSNRAKVYFDQKTRTVVEGDKVIKKLLRTKFTDWKYENEYRLFIELPKLIEESGNYFIDFSSDIQLQEVILGMNSDLSISRMRNLLGGALASVRIRKAGMALREFKIIENRLFRSSIAMPTA